MSEGSGAQIAPKVFVALVKLADGNKTKIGEINGELGGRPVGWTDADNETLKRMAGNGYSAGQIADALGWPSRNAVIGRASRMGVRLCGRVATRKTVDAYHTPIVTTLRKRAHRRPTIAADFTMRFGSPAVVPQPAPKPIVPEPAPIVSTGPKSLLKLGAKDCRFPLGPKLAAAELFCAAPVRAGSSYCTEHHALCWTPATRPKRPML